MNSNELSRLILNLARKGAILEVDHQAALCRVASGELQTNWIPWMTIAAGTTRDWRPPTIGEQVVLLCPGGDPAEAVAVCGIYSTKAPAPSNSPDTHTRIYPDGAAVEYNHKAHRLTVVLPAGGEILVESPSTVTIRTASVRLEADLVVIDAPSTQMTGNLAVAGSLAVTGAMTGGGKLDIASTIEAGGEITTPADVKAGAISLTGHDHMEQGDGKPVGPAR